MHPELRLIEDFMTDKGVLNLPAQPRMGALVTDLADFIERAKRSAE